MTEFILKLIGIIIGSYIIGSINFAVLVSKIFRTDIRTKGSGNPGTVNMLRSVGLRAAALTLSFDVLKAALPALGAYFLMRGADAYFIPPVSGAPGILGYYIGGVSKACMFISGFFVILGHVFPLFMRFKGGKGAASTIGVFLAADPVIGFAVFVIAVGYLLIGKYGSVTSFIFTISMTVIEVVFAEVFKDNAVGIAAPLCICALVLFAHRSNIKRLIKGTETDTNLMTKFREVHARRTAAKNSEPKDPE
ncbi:MAG: glycerol-3-phosphate acyltransferase [Clostridiales bacterium]|jgi:glycerol-3-phosphate acyltransferase PlsY|nr:glycerol-3-phosphate acyltransferase [Clostridiales bacterium]